MVEALCRFADEDDIESGKLAVQYLKDELKIHIDEDGYCSRQLQLFEE